MEHPQDLTQLAKPMEVSIILTSLKNTINYNNFSELYFTAMSETSPGVAGGQYTEGPENTGLYL